MKRKRIIRIIVFFFIFLFLDNVTLATQEEILQNQQETLNIKGFIKEANKYTNDVFSGIDANDLINDAIKGEIDNKTIFSKILSLFGKEVRQTLQLVRRNHCYYCYT